MAKISEQIELIIDREINKKITRSNLIKATEAAGNEAIKIMIDRANEGIDLNGKRFAKLSEKEPFEYSYGFKKRTNPASLLKGKATTKYKVAGFPNHMRLTGSMFSSLQRSLAGLNIAKNRITAGFKVFLKGDESKKIGWLASKTGATRGWGGRGKKTVYSKPERLWFGICTAAARQKKELDRIKKVFLSKLGLSTEVIAKVK